MILPDTNQVNQAAAVVADVKTTVQTNWTAIVFAVALISRELRNFNAWLNGVAEWIISHGGIVWLCCKLFWNPPAANPHADEILTRLRSLPAQPSTLNPQPPQ